MTNKPLPIIKIMSDYINTWWTIMVRPIYFYTKLREEDWKENALTFLLISSWILAALAALIVFIIQYLPIGATLIEGVAGLKLIIILPVLFTLALVFFLITFFIIGGLMILGFFAMFAVVAVILHYTFTILGGKGRLERVLQKSFYSAAIILFFSFLLILMLLTKYGGLDFHLFRVGFELIYFFTVLYGYGLWAIAGRKAYGIPKWKAFVGALVPAICLLIFGLAFDKIALSKLRPWIT